MALFMIVAPGMAADFKAEVIRVLDGDTIEVLHEKKPERIRLYGIDCPEKLSGIRAEGEASHFLASLRQGGEN
jgi:endonuclease YncB( thermonuclease family)